MAAIIEPSIKWLLRLSTYGDGMADAIAAFKEAFNSYKQNAVDY
jgi:hypothetical protein